MAYLDYISDENLIKHIKKTLSTYSETIKSIDLAKFNSNLIDPIKLTFDSNVYNKDMETIIKEEIARQRDKTNTNAIGYFHQNIFKYFATNYFVRFIIDKKNSTIRAFKTRKKNLKNYCFNKKWMSKL